MDSSATDSGTEDVLSSQMLVGSFEKKYEDHTLGHDDRQLRQYKTKKYDNDGDWLAKRSGSDLRTGHKVIRHIYSCPLRMISLDSLSVEYKSHLTRNRAFQRWMLSVLLF